MGTLEGIQEIKPPRRIFFYPYASTYYNTSENAKGEVEGSLSYNAGLDLKLGLSDAFTMDVTLIPDFGQTLSDQQILNLSAFEVQFTENRQFFTEGTELFSRANIFYSRRIGFEKPINYYDAGNKLNEHEKLLENPLKDQIVNAIKISGRDKKNLGIGFFNAVTKPSYAISIDTTSGIERKIETSSLTNYNVFVLDQILPNNSYVSVINTSVIRGGEDFDVNVLGGQFEIRNKLNKYSISGSGAMSAKYGRSFSSPAGRDDNGFREEFNLNKIKGNFLITIGQYIKNDTYDPTDLGFLTANNLFGFYSTARYIIYKPFGRFNKLSTKLTTNLNNLYRPSNFTEWNNIFEGVLSTKRFNSYGINFEATPVRGFDFFEPRVSGRFFRTYTNQLAGAWYSSDYRKKIAIDLGVWYTQFEIDNRHKFNWRCAPRFRLNDHLFITYVYSYQSHNNDIGFAYAYEDDARTKPLFGTRDVISHTNVLNLKYAFNPTMTLNTRVRHYWGYTRFKEFHSLMDDGYLGSTTMTSSDQSFNSFTIDMIFSWILKPGSELSLVWKNAIVDFDDSVPDNLTSDFDYTFSKPQNNSYSVKLIYFVDYHSTSRKMKERLGLLKD